MADRDVDVVTKVRVTWKHLVEIADMLACRAVTVDDKQRVENENKHETAEWRHGGTACDDDKEAGGSDGTKSDEKSNSPCDDWERLWCDDGNCLDESAMDELTSRLNDTHIEIKTRKPDYYNIDVPRVDVDEDEFGHIIEVYGFSSDIKTENILFAFSKYKSTWIDIKWIDDTSCLLIFSSSAAAKQALVSPPSFMKVRPASQGSLNARAKVKQIQNSAKPVEPRPETSAVVARRLVLGSLGIRSSIGKEKIEREQRQLREARERKREMKRKQKEAWGD
ncbi:coiled-coil domain-containing protein R3HCC1L-like [Corticium candelabrum]|uniref:coiled-coil domain-containing protein R3HCC1L-like n=1 Tax=Corticium candelabrum TaxID=121492 RepID=UPI002E26BABB|nr:coiled-coil domain-containing protein R3HCC1L-like [Corticium candelabrum]